MKIGHWAAALAVAGTLALAGCGGGGSGPGATETALVQGVPSTAALVAANRAPGVPASFGDVDPHEWVGRTPASYAVHGIDAARYQGEIDWGPAARAGVRFAWLKATEGGDHIDPGYALNSEGARRAGVAVGAYHFYYFCRPAAEQAAWFIENVPKRRGDLPPMLDMEWNHLSPTCQLRPPAAEVRASIREFSRIVEAHFGTAPVVYTTPDFYERNGLGQLAGQEYFLRSVTAHPNVRYPNERWTFWQYSGTGLVPGIAGKVDLNAFSGGEGAWRSWRARRSQ